MNRSQTEEPARPPAEAAEHLDELLDEALADTFPASDPVAISSDDRARALRPKQ